MPPGPAGTSAMLAMAAHARVLQPIEGRDRLVLVLRLGGLVELGGRVRECQAQLLHDSLSPLGGSCLPRSAASSAYSLVLGWIVSQAGSPCLSAPLSEPCSACGTLADLLHDRLELRVGGHGGAPPGPPGPARPRPLGTLACDIVRILVATTIERKSISAGRTGAPAPLESLRASTKTFRVDHQEGTRERREFRESCFLARTERRKDGTAPGFARAIANLIVALRDRHDKGSTRIECTRDVRKPRRTPGNKKTEPSPPMHSLGEKVRRIVSRLRSGCDGPGLTW